MHDSAQSALRTALTNICKKRADVLPQRLDLQLVWTKRSAGLWDGSYQEVPVVDYSWEHGLDFEALAAPFQDALIQHHPEYKQTVGTATVGWRHCGGGALLRQSAYELVRSDFRLDPSRIDDVVGTVSAFVDATRLGFTYFSPLINFQSELDGPINLANGVQIRKLTEQEFTRLYGGSLYRTQHSAFQMPEWIFSGSVEESKTFGPGVVGDEDPAFSIVLKNLNNALVGLRTFQKGVVGYGQVTFMPDGPAKFLGGIVSRGQGNDYVPLGTYHLDTADLDALLTHIERIAKGVVPALDVALSRLSGATIRVDPRDQLIDSVIGLEAILLAEVGSKLEYRGETRFRFSMNYAHLQPVEKRREAYTVARDLYDLRSTIAHGGSVTDVRKIGGKPMKLEEASAFAAELLRELVKECLKDAPSYPWTEGFWQSRYFPSA